MKILNNFTQGSEQWLSYREGKISGTALGDLYSPRGTRKIGFYELISQRLSDGRDDEDRRERGLRLEEEAIKEFEKKTGLKVERAGVCIHDKYPDIINSPDGLIKSGKVYKEAIEIKCLSPARHWQAIIENKMPKEFETQVCQYFVVNTELENLYLVFYDPDNYHVPFHIITITRKELGNRPQEYLDFQIQQLEEIKSIVERYSF